MNLLQISPSLQGQIAFGLSILSTLLGLVIGYIALQGYRRNRQRPMLFIAVGFFLVFWTPVLLLIGPYLAPIVGQFIYGVLGEVSQIVGLLCILYGLRMPTVRSE